MLHLDINWGSVDQGLHPQAGIGDMAKRYKYVYHKIVGSCWYQDEHDGRDIIPEGVLDS